MLHLFEVVWKFNINILGKVSLSSNYVYLSQWEVIQLVPHLHVVRTVIILFYEELTRRALYKILQFCLYFYVFGRLPGFCQAALGISGFCLLCLRFGIFFSVIYSVVFK